jgi:MFS family permease
MALVIGVGLNLLLIRQKKSFKDTSEDLEKKKAPVKASVEYDGIPLKQVFKSLAIYFFIPGMMAGAIITGAFSTYGTTFFVSFDMSKTDASSFLSLYTIFCGLHVIWTGFFQSRFGSQIFIVTQYLCVILGLVFLTVWANIGSAVFVILGLLFLSLIKPINSTSALLIPDLFGRKDYVAINSLTNGFYYAGVCISMLTTAAIMMALGGATALIYMGIMAVLALVFFTLALIVSPYKKLKKQQQQIKEGH